MSVSFVAASTATGNDATLTVDKPAGTVQDDVIVIVAYKNNPAANLSSSGFTRVLLVNPEKAVLWKVAGASEPATYDVTTGSASLPGAVVATTFRGLDGAAPVGTVSTVTVAPSGGSLAIPNYALSVDSPRLLTVGMVAQSESLTVDSPPWTFRTRAAGSLAQVAVADYPYAGLASNNTTGLGSWNGFTTSVGASTHTVELIPGNEPPDAPNLTFPTSQTINLAQTNRFAWDFSDPDTDDSQSQFQLQLRPQLSTVNTVDVTSETVNTFYDLAGSTLTAGDYEWRVRTWDAIGEVGPYSAWAPFTAAAAPAGPSITDPVNGGTITTETYTVRWSAAAQDAYQLRRVADNAGSPNTATVYFDTGTVTSSTTRQLAVEFETNSRTEHVQVRVQRDTLWSDWDSVSVNVSYTTPATPTLTVSAGAVVGGIQLQASHPTPGVGVPTVETVDLERRVTGETASLRVAAGLAPTAVFVDWTVASGVAYEYRARAYGDNGTSSYGAWTA